MVVWDAGLVGLSTFLLVVFITLLILSISRGRPKNFPPGKKRCVNQEFCLLDSQTFESVIFILIAWPVKGTRDVTTLFIGMMILPGVGSLLSMPFGPNMEVMRGLRKKYGDIASFAIFGTR